MEWINPSEGRISLETLGRRHPLFLNMNFTSFAGVKHFLSRADNSWCQAEVAELESEGSGSFGGGGSGRRGDCGGEDVESGGGGLSLRYRVG